jgi:hypothetical protein
LMNSKHSYGAFQKKKPKQARRIRNIPASGGPFRDLHQRMIFFPGSAKEAPHGNENASVASAK